MKNLYFTVDMNADNYHNSSRVKSGFSWIAIHNKRQIAFSIITFCSYGFSNVSYTSRYILESFKGWIESVISEEAGYSFSSGRIIRDISRLINDWNKYMFDYSCNEQVMNASVLIIVMTGDRYVTFQVGKAAIISCVGYRAKLIIGNEEPLGRHSSCRIIVNKGHVRYGDIFFLYSGIPESDNHMWYIRHFLQKRRRYTRRRGRGMSGRDVMRGIADFLSKSSEIIHPFALVCCERSEV